MAGSSDLAVIREACEAQARVLVERGKLDWPDFEHWHVLETRLEEEGRAVVLWADRRTHPIAIENTLTPTKVAEMRSLHPVLGWRLIGFHKPEHGLIEV